MHADHAAHSKLCQNITCHTLHLALLLPVVMHANAVHIVVVTVVTMLLRLFAAVGRNRSKYQPRGHFDAAVGGRRRPQKAGTGSALEQLRQHRLQQLGAAGDHICFTYV